MRFYSILRRKWTVCVLSLFALAVLSLPAQAQMNGTNYTINKNGTATATNFKTFASAVQALRGVARSDGGPGLGGGVNGPVTITVTPGTGPYTEQVVIPAITGTSSTNRVTIDGSGETVQFSGTSTSNMFTWRMNGADYFTVKNLTIKTLNTTYGWGMMFDNSSDYNIVEDCKVDITSVTSTTINNSVGIAFTGSTTSHYGSNAYSGGSKGIGNIIRRNEIFGSSTNNGMYMGITIAGDVSNTSRLYNTIIEDNIIRNFYIYGVYAYYYHNNLTFRGNDIRRGTKPTITTFYGIYSYYNMGANYYSNKIRQVTPGSVFNGYVYGIYNLLPTYTTTKSEYFNNLLDMSGAGYGYGIMAYYGTGHDIYHNTIYWRTSTLYYVYALYLYDYTYQATYNVKNNIVDLDGTSMLYGIYDIYYYSLSSQLNSNHNVLTRNSNASAHYTAYDAYSGMNYQTLANWQSYAATPDMNSVNIRPTYINTGAGNFEPMTIDLDGMGTTTPVNTDINGNARSLVAPDPGSYEFDIPINVSAINYPNSICQGDVVDVEVTIQNNSILNLANFYVQFEIDGQLKATEIFTSTINAGNSAVYKFTTQVVNSTTGGFVLKANVKGKSPVTQINYTVSPSPVGSFISQGSTFQGTYLSGNSQDPDIVAYGDNINYLISPPAGYTNGQYNSTWAFDKWELVTVNGTTAGAQHQTTAPGASDGRSSFTPVISQSDSTYVLRYAIKSLVNGCVAPTVERYLFVAPRPVADFVSLSACAGAPVVFDNNSTISSGTMAFMWYFGDGDSSVLINPSHTYATPGTYNAQLKVISNYGYTSIFNSSAQVKENPVAEFGFANACEGTAIQFTDGSVIPVGSPSYSWNFGDGSQPSVANNPSHLYAQAGVYEVSMSVEVNGCKAEKKAYVTQAPRANVSFTPSATTCNNDMVSFTNNTMYSGGAIGYSWNFGDNNTSNSFHAQHNYVQAGNYTVTLTATTAFGCVNTSTTQVSLVEAPKADFTSSNLCSIENLTFTNTSTEPAGNTSYQWTFSDGYVSGAKDVTRSFGNTGTYSVELKAMSNNGCEDVIQKVISVDEMPTAQFYASDACEGSAVEFQNASIGNNGNVSYAWDFDGDNSIDASTKNANRVLAPGTYNATLTVTTPSGCESTQTKTVTVRSLPSATLNVNTAQVGGGVFTLSAVNVANAKSYLWLFGDGGKESGSVIGNSINTVYQYLADGAYDISLRLMNEGCDVVVQSTALVSRTNVNQVELTGLQVYPNPSNGLVNLSLNNGESIESYRVFTMDGKEVAVTVQNNQNGVVSLNMASLSPGIYQIQVQTGNGLHVTKLTIAK